MEHVLHLQSKSQRTGFSIDKYEFLLPRPVEGFGLGCEDTMRSLGLKKQKKLVSGYLRYSGNIEVRPRQDVYVIVVRGRI